MNDTSHRFLFDQTDIRGELVVLEQSYQEVLAVNAYPAAVGSLLGEFMAASTLLGATLKFDGVLTLQARSQGEIPLIMSEFSSDRSLRAIARQAGQARAQDFQGLLGGGTLAITIQPRQSQQYQGIVPLSGDNLAGAIIHYFEQSEQLDTWLFLCANEQRAAGLLLQALPASKDRPAEDRATQWQHVISLANTLSAAELLELPAADLLYRLYHEQGVRLMPPNPVRFNCSCSSARIARALASVGRAEAEDILAEQGKISMSCEFCNATYELGPADVGAVFGDPEEPQLH
jgi:molecular chaperone Hsp33